MSAAPPLPHDLGAWYPLLRGQLSCRGHHSLAEALESAPWEALAPGESLLVEAELAPLRSLVAAPLATLLARLPRDFRVERFHVLPGTGGGRVLLPADDPRAYRAGLDLLPGGRLRWRLVKRALRGAGALGWSRPPHTGELALLTRTPTPVPRLVSSALSGRLAGVAGGVPGPGCKTTILLASPSGRPERIVKLGGTPDARTQIQREVESLLRLARSAPGADLAPRLIDEGVTEECAFLIQETLPGTRSPDRLGPEHFEFLRDVCRRTLRRSPLKEIASFTTSADLIGRLAPSEEGDDWATAMDALRSAVERTLGTRQVPCSLAHGDFTPWNLRRDGGVVRAFDWEFTERAAPALHDLFHFLVQTGILVRRRSAARLLADARALLTGSARPLLQDALLEPDTALAHLALYLLHVATRDEARYAVERPPFEQVAWLRRTRSELALLLARELGAPDVSAPGSRLPNARPGQGRAA